MSSGFLVDGIRDAADLLALEDHQFSEPLTAWLRLIADRADAGEIDELTRLALNIAAMIIGDGDDS